MGQIDSVAYIVRQCGKTSCSCVHNLLSECEWCLSKCYISPVSVNLRLREPEMILQLWPSSQFDSGYMLNCSGIQFMQERCQFLSAACQSCVHKAGLF